MDKKKRGRPKKEEEVDFADPVIDSENLENDEQEEQAYKEYLAEKEAKKLNERLSRLKGLQKKGELEDPDLIDKPNNYESKSEEYNGPSTMVEYKSPTPPLEDNIGYPVDSEEKVKDIRLNETKEGTSFWGKLFKKHKVKNANMVAVILLHPTTQATVDYIKSEEDGSFKIGENTYHIHEHCIYNLTIKKDRYPLCILPTWTMIPLGTKAWFDLSQERRGHELEKMILNAIKKEEAIKIEEPKKKGGLSAKTIWILIAVVVGGYIFLKSSGKV